MITTFKRIIDRYIYYLWYIGCNMVCKQHKWIKLYYRKQNKKDYQDWIAVPNKVICQNCEVVADIK